MDLKDLGKEVGAISVVLALIAVIALGSGAGAEFFRDLAGEWMWWVGALVAVVALFGAWRRLRRR